MEMSSNWAITETYHDVEGLLFHISKKFMEKYGGDYREIFSEACEHFMAAYARYNPEMGKFNRWVYFRVWHCLLETVRRRATKNSYMPRVYDVQLEEVARKENTGYSREKLLQDLSDDAKVVVQLIFDAPLDVQLELKTLRREPSPQRYQLIIKHYLRDIGWTQEKIEDTFSEIAEAL